MARKKQKIEPEEVGKLEEVIEMCNDIDEIETVSETVPEPTEVNSNDVMLPRSSSLYTKPLR